MLIKNVWHAASDVRSEGRGMSELALFTGDVLTEDGASLALPTPLPLVVACHPNALQVLVNESASRQQVMQLAETLRTEFGDHYGIIEIFDSRTAWQRRDDESYWQERFHKHLLVQIIGQEIHWVAEGRAEGRDR